MEFLEAPALGHGIKHIAQGQKNLDLQVMPMGWDLEPETQAAGTSSRTDKIISFSEKLQHLGAYLISETLCIDVSETDFS